MRADPRFAREGKDFWANVRCVSEALGYTNSAGQINVPTLSEIRGALGRLQLGEYHLSDRLGNPTPMGILLLDYFAHRAEALNDLVRLSLMSGDEAAAEFEKLRARVDPQCPLPMNKQKGEKRRHAFLTGIVNMIIWEKLGGGACCYDPRRLTTFTRDGIPLRTLARRVDGAFPATVNPIALWEIKEYYYTTTFGSRVADGVYETLLDGAELEELREHGHVEVEHCLIVDGYRTWWMQGRSYLCRIVDMLHMGYVDEVLFGREVLVRLPEVVERWSELERERRARSQAPRTPPA